MSENNWTQQIPHGHVGPWPPEPAGAPLGQPVNSLSAGAAPLGGPQPPAWGPQTYEEGRAEGYREGYDRGHDAGYAAGLLAAEKAAEGRAAKRRVPVPWQPKKKPGRPATYPFATMAVGETFCVPPSPERRGWEGFKIYCYRRGKDLGARFLCHRYEDEATAAQRGVQVGTYEVYRAA